MLSIKELLNFIDGNLSTKRTTEIEQIILAHPFYFEVIADLNRIKKDLGANDNVLQHLNTEKKKAFDFGNRDCIKN